MSRIYIYHYSFVPDENDIIMFNGVLYQILTRTKNETPMRFPKTTFQLLLRKGVLKKNKDRDIKTREQWYLHNPKLTFYYFDMQRFRELTGTSQPVKE